MARTAKKRMGLTTMGTIILRGSMARYQVTPRWKSSESRGSASSWTYSSLSSSSHRSTPSSRLFYPRQFGATKPSSPSPSTRTHPATVRKKVECSLTLPLLLMLRSGRTVGPIRIAMWPLSQQIVGTCVYFLFWLYSVRVIIFKKNITWHCLLTTWNGKSFCPPSVAPSHALFFSSSSAWFSRASLTSKQVGICTCYLISLIRNRRETLLDEQIWIAVMVVTVCLFLLPLEGILELWNRIGKRLHKLYLLFLLENANTATVRGTRLHAVHQEKKRTSMSKEQQHHVPSSESW